MMRDLVEEIELHDEAPLNFEEYEWRSMDTAIYPGALLYPILGLVGEAGEVAEKVKKHFRDGNHNDVQVFDPETEMSPEFRRELAKELGDVLWYVTAVASDIGYSLEEVAALNLDKLQSRQDRDQLHGSGDGR